MNLIVNKSVNHHYEIIDSFTAGIALEGWEVKSLRGKNANIKAAWIKSQEDELFLVNLSISPYRYANDIQEKERPRKLLLKRREIDKITTKLKEKTITLLPKRIFTAGKNIKCEVVLARGMKQYEKRQKLKEKTLQKEAQKAMKKY